MLSSKAIRMTWYKVPARARIQFPRVTAHLFAFVANRRIPNLSSLPQTSYKPNGPKAVELQTPAAGRSQACGERESGRGDGAVDRAKVAAANGARASLQVGREGMRPPGQRFAAERRPPNLGARHANPESCREGPWRP